MMNYIFNVAPQKVYYNGTTGFTPETFGTGAMTLEECEAIARKYARRSHDGSVQAGLGAIYTGWFKVEVRKPCATCRVSGIKPGYKRKKCETCEGRGAVEVHTFVFNAV